MKRIMLFVMAGLVTVSMLTSCAASKRDCQGVRHTRLKNGIYI